MLGRLRIAVRHLRRVTESLHPRRSFLKDRLAGGPFRCGPVAVAVPFALVLSLLLAACAPCDVGSRTCAPPGKVASLVPIWTDGCTLLVDVGLNGHEEKLVLDTGAGWPTVAEGTAREVGADPVGTVRVVHSGGAMGDALVDAAPWLSPAFKGSLGNDLLQNWDVDLDLPDGVLAFERPQTCRRPRASWTGDAVAVAVDRGGDEVAFPISVDGARRSAILDSGATVTTLAGASPARASTGDPGGVVEYGYEGTFRARPRLIHHLVVGGHDLGDLPAVEADGWKEPEALLGLDFLARHRVLISYRARTLFIAPATVPPAPELTAVAGGVLACRAP